MVVCPKCNQELSEQELKTLWGKYTVGRRSEKKGGRPRAKRITAATPALRVGPEIPVAPVKVKPERPKGEIVEGPVLKISPSKRGSSAMPEGLTTSERMRWLREH